MKKRVSIIGFSALLSSILLFSACTSVPELSFNANWYRNTALKANIGGTNERLEYEVSFTPYEKNGFSIDYSNGSFVTELKNGDVGGAEGYLFTTDLEIFVSFSLNGEKSETFRDVVHTEAKFRSAAEGLRPVSSKREVLSHVPVSDQPDSLPLSYAEYHYSYAFSYEEEAGRISRANFTHTNLANMISDREKHFDIKSGSFLDNEQILFALRGVELSTLTRFTSINAVTERAQEIEISNKTDVEYSPSFSIGGNLVEKKISAAECTLGYLGSDRGTPQVLTYAKTTDPSANEYRNVLLKMETPVLYSLGVLRYELKSAQFSDK